LMRLPYLLHELLSDSLLPSQLRSPHAKCANPRRSDGKRTSARIQP
jgi:hypothetical protein